MKSVLSVAAAAVLLAPMQSRADEKAELAKLKGEYKPVKLQRGGMDAPPAVLKSVLQIEGNKFTIVSTAGGMERKSTLVGKIDDSKKPKHLDLSRDGKPRYAGIYKVEGKKLTICYDAADKGRPKKFDSPAGTRVMLMVFEKKK